MAKPDFIIDWPRTYTDEAVRQAFDMFGAEHPDVLEEWIRRETPRTEPDPDLREISGTVQRFLRSNFRWTDQTALSSFWLDMRGIVYGMSMDKRVKK